MQVPDTLPKAVWFRLNMMNLANTESGLDLTDQHTKLQSLLADETDQSVVDEATSLANQILAEAP